MSSNSVSLDDNSPVKENDINALKDSDEDEDESDISLNLAKEKVSKDPYNYTAHIELITTCQTLGDLLELRQSRENMSKLFPLTPELWLSWLKDEASLADSDPASKQAVIELFERAVGDYLSVQVWLQYVQFAVNHIKTADDVESVRVLFERAVSAAGQHVSKGSLIWTAYRQFECSLLEHLETGGVECSQQRDICVGLFFRQLSLPLLDTQATYNLFLEWSSSRLSNIPSLAMDNIKLAVQHTLKELLQILPFEDALTSSLDTSVKVDIFKSYILREKQHGKEAQRVSILYERALVMNPLDQLLWLEYVHFADRHLAPADTVLGVCSRSTRNCPWFTELWRQKLFLMEKYHQSSHEDMQGVLEQALAVEYTSASDYLLLWLAYADYMRRRIEQDSDQQDQQVTAFTELLAQACEHLAQRFGLKGDPQCILLQYWARIEAAYKGDMEKVRLLWNDIMTQGHSQFAEMWLEYILLERIYGDTKHLRRLYARALRAVEDTPDKIATAWVNFERDKGTLESYQASCDAYKERMKEFSAKQIPARIPLNKHQEKTKRKAPSEDAVKAKNRKIEESSSKQAIGSVAKNRTKTTGKTTKTISDKKQEPDAGSKHQPTDDAKVAHADRCVFLSNLAYTVSEEDVKEIFSAVGSIAHVSIEKDSKGKSKGFGHVEFQNKIAAQEALKKDREPVKGRLMFVSQYAVDRQHRANPASMFAKTLEKTKLFVKGLPISVTEDDLKSIFGQHATPKAVRLVTFKTGKSRGFAYVEFSTEEEARKVLEMLDGTELQGHKISVAFSDPSFRRQEDSSNNLGAHSRSLAGGDSRTNKPTWHPRTQVSFVPRVLQMAPGKPPTFSSNHSDADNSTSSEGKVLSNADFRQMLLGTKN